MKNKSFQQNLKVSIRRVVPAATLGLVAMLFATSAMFGQKAPQPGPIDPPALPATDPPSAGKFGTAISSTTINPSFPLPNTSTWTPLGPAPLSAGGSASGRLTSVAVDKTDANTIYVGAAGGGVWKTTDGGTSWNPMTDTQNSLSIGALAIAPTNRLKIYAGTGEANNSGDSNFGLGILVSSDGGTTWTLSTGPGGVFNRLATAAISVDPTSDQIAYVAMADFAQNGLCCANTGIYKTTNGGSTWVNVTAANGKDSARPWSDVVVDPNNSSIIYAAHGDIFGFAPNGVYRSIDSGATWTLLANAPSGVGIGRIALAVAPSANTANQHVLYVAIANTTGNGGTLFQMLRSDNADATTPTFTNLTTTPNFSAGGQGWYDWIIGVDPTNAANVYAAGSLNYTNNTNHAIRSTNSGATWTDITVVGGIQPHTDSHGMGFDAAGRMYLGNDGGIWRFNNTVPSWTNLNSNLNTIQFTGIGLHPTDTQKVIGGSQDNGTEFTSGSLTWNAVDGGDGGFSLISQTNPSICYSNHPIGSFGTTQFMRKSTNSCVSWTSITPAITNSGLFNFYAPIFVDPSNGNRVFLGGDFLYESTNAGSTWNPIPSPSNSNPIDTIAIQPGGNTYYVANNGVISASTTNGTPWVTKSLPVSGKVSELDIDPNDSTANTVIAVIGTFNGVNGQVYRTTNGGTNWTNITGNLPAIPTWSAKIDTDASKTIYVSTETAVYSSPSPYGTWTIYGSGLPKAQGVQLQINSSPTVRELALATHGRGAWYIGLPSLFTAPTIAKAFSPTTIQSGGTSTVTVTLTNPNASALTSASFTDTLSNMSAAGGSVTGTCAGTTPSTLVASVTALSFTGITIPASSSCTVIFAVTSSTAGVNPNTTSGITTAQTTVGTASNTANLTVLAAPGILKAFNPSTIASGGTSTVTFTLSNSNTSTTLTGASFTDTLTNMSAVPGSLGGTCNAASTLSGSPITFNNFSIANSANCTITFNVTSSSVGNNPNITSGVTTTQTTIAGAVSNTANLTVTAATLVSIAVTPANPIVAVGQTQQFTATGTFSDNSTQNITGSVTWASLAPGVASITTGGLATGVSAGTVTIRATSGAVSGSTLLTVNAAALVSIAVTPVNPSVPKGLTQQFTATGTFSDNSTQNITNTVTWTSGSPAVATILAASGLATAVAASGTAQITATAASGVNGSTTLTAVAPTLQSIAVTPANPIVAVGQTQQFTATGTFSDNSTQNITGSVTWASLAPGVASITTGGLATGVSAGTVTIRATSGAVSGSTLLTVNAAATPPTVVSYNVLFGSTSYNVIGSARNRLPWTITGIQVVFSKPITAGNINSLSGVTATGFSGLGTNTLTWTLNPITNLPLTATSLAGSGPNALTDSGGNGLAGGSGFSQNLKVLYADFNDDGVVNAQDLVLVNAARPQAYNIFADLNGDGVVDINDVTVVRTQVGNTNP